MISIVNEEFYLLRGIYFLNLSIMKKLLLILLLPVFIFADEYEYSLQDYNATSPTYGLDVWLPEYLDYITLHYFSSQG